MSLNAEVNYVSKAIKNQTHLYRLLINNEWVDSSSGDWFNHVCPTNIHETTHTCAVANVDDVTKAVTAAHKAFSEGPWPRLSAVERVKVLEKACGLIEANVEKLATTLSKETGRPNSPIPLCSLEISGSVIEVLKYFCAQALTYEGSSNTTYNNATTLTIVEPVGVVAGIVPWNYPLMLFTHKVAPALAAGCTVVIKSSPFTAGSTYDLALLFHQAGLPAGVLNVITGLGSVVGSALASHPLVSKISFTGSIETSKKVIVASSSNLKRVTLEGGGKSPNIIFKDTDLDTIFAPTSFFPFSCCLLHSGQVCAIGSRLLVHEDVKDKVVERLKALFEGPFKTVGAITMKEQLQKIEDYVALGKAEKATLVCGGTKLTDGDLANGYYFASTIFTDVTPNMKIFQDEIFGPVLSVTTFKTTEEAITLANSVAQGLACMIWSNNLPTVMECCKKIKAGFFMINKFGPPGPHEAFGGLKQSGWGKELGKEGYQAYLDVKTVSFHC